MGELAERFPLFPLSIVLLPSEILPLHIFEERYKVMIGECLDEGREFGIVWLSDDGLKDIGCTAAVAQVLERMDDGRMNILVRGARPFRLLRKIEDLPYPAGDVEFLDDDDPDAEPDLAEEARERYADLVERVTDKRPEGGDLQDLDAYGMAATIEFALEPEREERGPRQDVRQPGRALAPSDHPVVGARHVAAAARALGEGAAVVRE